MSAYRVGIIGTGRIASEFEDSMPQTPASITGAFQVHPECVVVAGCNRGRERLEKFGKRWGVEALYHDCERMLAEQDLDIVAVATPPGLHRDQVVTVAEAGVKGVFCEKPMALSIGECDDMIAACEANGVKLLVNCTRRWGGGYESVREAAREGRWGPLLHMVGFCQGCKPLPDWEAEFEGPMLHDAVHMYDLMRFYAGDVDWVLGTASRRLRDNLRVEDTSLSILQFKSGVQGVTVVDELTEYSRFELELHFERGLVKLNPGFSVQTSVPAGLDESWWYELQEEEAPAPAWQGTGILHAVRDLVNAIETGGETRSTGEDGRAAIEIIMALYECERRGHQKVYLPFDEPRRMLDVLRQEGIYG